MNKKVPKGQSRLNIIIDEKMKSFVKRYADKNKTTVTHIIYQTFQRIRDDEQLFGNLDKNLLSWVDEYVRRKNTTVNDLINNYFRELKKEEDGIGIKQI